MKKIIIHLRTTFTIAILTLAISAINAAAATFTVSNTNDSGAGSLRDAITQSNTNNQADTINFDPAVFNVARTITLTSGEITILSDNQTINGQPGKPVTINGPGANLLTISGNNAGRIFFLPGNPQNNTNNANVTISGMTLRNGNAATGGAIFVQQAASLTLNSMVIRNNLASGTTSAGGIYSEVTQNLVINDSLITENSAHNNGGMYINADSGNGAVVYSFIMRNTIVSNNTATGTNVGAFSVDRGSTEIKNSQITGNTAARVGGGMSFFQSILNISDTVISNNTGPWGVGGMTADTSNATLRRVRISNNTAGYGQGGGMAMRVAEGNFTIIDSTISNNTVGISQQTANSEGGGIYIGFSGGTIKIINTTVSGNSAGRAGGGIVNDNDNTTLINSTVVNNTAANGNSFVGGGGIVAGCALRDGVPCASQRIFLQNSIVANNISATGPDFYSTFTSNGYNIIGNTTGSAGSTANTGDLFNVNPQLAALANNGGPTQTHALLAGSPAINAGSNALAVDQNGVALRFDQRGPCYNRRVGGTTDIGAFEFGAVRLAGRNSPFDFDGDCKSDISVFRPSNGTWYLNQSTDGIAAVGFGLGSDLLAPADFDGDGITDIAVFRPSNGAWYYLQSSDGAFVGQIFGQNGDLPRPGDFDGDGRADLAVFRPSNGVWYLQQSTNGFAAVGFGSNGDKPLVADFDGDGKNDIAVFRPSNATFYRLESSTGAFKASNFGLPTDIPTMGDFDGDGKTDIAVFRPSNGVWYRNNSSNGAFAFVSFGTGGDIPTPGDYDSDGKTDVAVFRPSNGNWYYQNSSNGGFVGQGFGLGTDKPVPAAFQ